MEPKTYLETLYDYNDRANKRYLAGYSMEVKREETWARRIAGTIEILK